MKVCDKTCIFCFFPIIKNYLCMAKRSLLSRCPSYIVRNVEFVKVCHFVGSTFQYGEYFMKYEGKEFLTAVLHT